ncbi:MAG: hypothetical protein KDA65_09615, partial [Planctomycetaceae bacterium]|nr:hypothetical protein [Planctomycetaceae bacterium]
EVAEQSTASSDEESVAEKSTSHDEEMVRPQSIQTPLEIGGIVAIILVLLMLFRGRRLQKD